MTTSITLRATKGSALTHSEMDTNLTNLQTTADQALAASDTLTANKAEATALGVANTDQNMGSFTGTTIADNVSAKVGMQSLETAVETKANATAVGVTSSAANMGTYTGATIPDNETAKQNLQSLETAVEARPTSAALAASSGSSLVGFIQTGTGATATTVQAEIRRIGYSPEQYGAAETYSGAVDDTTFVQRALDRTGVVYLNRQYRITSALTIYGNTHIIGKPGAKITWDGGTTGNIIQDSSAVTSSDVNLNIILEDFEIDGGDEVAGGSGQIAINFYRTGNIILRNLNVHGVGGSGIRWGNSYTDTKNVLVENCRVYDCREGDAIQGSGRQITVRNCVVGVDGSTTSNFGDTGIALLHDFDATTNPSALDCSDVTIEGNTIWGNYNNSGTYVGNGGTSQTGIAFGPFTIGAEANISVLNNVVKRCYLNLWGIVMDKVRVEGNTFGAHAATATGNVRFDGVTNLTVEDNTFKVTYASGGAAYSALLMFAQRNTFGASVFDADIYNAEISNNLFLGESGVTAAAVYLSFAESNSSPSYQSKITDTFIHDNHFRNFTTRVSFAPVVGTGTDLCDNVTVAENVTDSTSGTFANFAGGDDQYKDTKVEWNRVPSAVALWGGAGAEGIHFQHKTTVKLAAVSSGAATTILALPATGYYRLELHGWYRAASSAASGYAEIVSNEGSPRLYNASNGGTMTVSLSGTNVQVTQTSGSAQTCYLSAIYS